jgi:hypothetical protein
MRLGTQKAIISYHVGNRDSDNTDYFIRDLRERVLGQPEINTDGFLPYLPAIRDTFGKDSRRYSPAAVIAVSRDVVSGLCVPRTPSLLIT